VLKAVRSGRRLYDERTLLRQVDEDLTVFRDVRPDLVVGDFRWSLAVSAQVFGVPHAALINAYWSPYAVRTVFPVPDHPILRLLGERTTAKYFPVALPHVFSRFAEPLNDARRAHGLPPVGSLLEVLTHGDFVLYADPPELVPTPSAPPTHEHIGFVPWAPDAALPAFWSAIPKDRPVVYATLGSSGSLDTLPLVVEALGGMDVTGLVATAGRKTLTRLPENVFAADFLPGDLAAQRSALVISNGGSSTSYQALAEGVPVLGRASNLDQYLAMTAIEASGAGQLVRARSATADGIRAAAVALMGSASTRQAAERVRKDIMRTSPVEKFRAFVERVTDAPPLPRTSRPASAPTQGGSGRAKSAWFGARLLSVLAIVAASASTRSAHAEGDAKPASASGEIRFTSKVPGSAGHVICALFRENGWLKKPLRSVKAPIRSHESTCVFADVETGMYAIVAFHDENDNGDIDKNFLGIPTEDWCTSRNAKAIFGPPSFGDAKFLSRGSIIRLGGVM
jgi:UDP:flavonoid glycosyltransferase YjiC (YdhE family)/uncharacterized protein (DUF2141 family)